MMEELKMTLKEDKQQLLKKIEDWENAREKVNKITEKIKEEEDKLQKPFKLEDVDEYLEINKTPLEKIKQFKKIIELINKEFPVHKLDTIQLARNVIAQEIKEDSNVQSIEKKYKKELSSILKAIEQIRELENELDEICSKYTKEWSRTSKMFGAFDLSYNYTRILPLFTRLRECELLHTSIQEIKEFLNK